MARKSLINLFWNRIPDAVNGRGEFFLDERTYTSLRRAVKRMCKLIGQQFVVGHGLDGFYFRGVLVRQEPKKVKRERRAKLYDVNWNAGRKS